jgi:membrane-associated phospholipid phosphatase
MLSVNPIQHGRDVSSDEIVRERSLLTSKGFQYDTGLTLPPGAYTLMLSASDGQLISTSLVNITVKAAVGLCTSNVVFIVTATDNCAVANVVSVPASGFAFPVGTTTVTSTVALPGAVWRPKPRSAEWRCFAGRP